MNRRSFNRLLSHAGVVCFLPKSVPGSFVLPSPDPELKYHKIDRLEIKELNYHWPRPVGKNGRRDVHGQYHKMTALKLFTNQGASGWGLTSVRVSEILDSIRERCLPTCLIHSRVSWMVSIRILILPCMIWQEKS